MDNRWASRARVGEGEVPSGKFEARSNARDATAGATAGDSQVPNEIKAIARNVEYEVFDRACRGQRKRHDI